MPPKVHKQTAPRNKYWSKETFLADLRKVGNLKGTCSLYADENSGWTGYYNSVRTWRDQDPKFDEEVKQILANSDTTMAPGPGRDRLDGGDLSWQDAYCAALYEFDGNRKLASAVTPYSFAQIMEMTDETRKSYDKAFAEKVKVAEAEIAAEIEAMVLGLRKPEAFGTFEQAKISQTKAWYALKILEKLDRARYGRYVDLNMKGNVTHTVEVLPREQKLFNLWEEQRKHLESRRALIAAGGDLEHSKTQEEGEVVDVEVVDE